MLVGAMHNDTKLLKIQIFKNKTFKIQNFQF